MGYGQWIKVVGIVSFCVRLWRARPRQHLTLRRVTVSRMSSSRLGDF